MSTPTQHPLISALDDLSMRRTGENGHTELEWSNKFSDSVVQFYFQLVRIDKDDKQSIKKISEKLREILYMAKSFIDCKKMSPTATDEETVELRKKIMPMFLALYKMIGQTRDIVMGKGEYTLTYIQIAVWYEFFPEAALFALDKCVFPPDEKEKQHQYGSWKDIKYFCNFLIKEHKYFNIPDMSPQHSLIKYALYLMVNQLRQDEKNYNLSFVASSTGPEHNDAYDKSKITLAARWAPRATSKQFGWMFNIMATMYYSNYLETATSEESRRRADRKAKTVFRKLLSRLNRFLETTQVKQCDPRGCWSEIDHNTVTSITARKQKKAFQYVKQTGESRSTEKPNSDREECAKRYSAHIAAALAGDKSHKVRGKRVGVGELVKDAINHETLVDSSLENTSEKQKKQEEERNVINLQWADNATQNENLGNMIACVDTSGSMSCDNGVPLHNAIGLGIRIAEKSALGKRIATFSATPSWVNLESARDFVACVEKVRNCNWGFNTNFHALLEMIMDAIKRSKLPVQQVKNMVLCVLSDMQIDSAEEQGNTDSMYELMKRRYYDLGMEMYGVPISPPHIVFWNLRKTDGFPSLTTEKNTTMMSGYSPVLLNAFIEKGMDALAEFSPETMFLELMNKPRYDCLEEHMRKIIIEEEEIAQWAQNPDQLLYERKRDCLFV